MSSTSSVNTNHIEGNYLHIVQWEVLFKGRHIKHFYNATRALHESRRSGQIHLLASDNIRLVNLGETSLEPSEVLSRVVQHHVNKILDRERVPRDTGRFHIGIVSAGLNFTGERFFQHCRRADNNVGDLLVRYLNAFIQSGASFTIEEPFRIQIMQFPNDRE